MIWWKQCVLKWSVVQKLDQSIMDNVLLITNNLSKGISFNYVDIKFY